MLYFNEHDPFAAEWLGNLWPEVRVDARSIEAVQPAELGGIGRAHFFAGIGGWEYALGLAGWPATRPVWTGSCPCQPFSAAGKGEGHGDARHLWPKWFRLIRECRPECVFGEQVARAIGYGWLDGVFADLEAEGYACGACVLGAHSVGAPHIRQRLYWVAHTERRTAERYRHDLAGAASTDQSRKEERERVRDDAGNGGSTLGLADAGGERCDGEPVRLRGRRSRQEGAEVAGSGATSWGDDWLTCLDGKARRVEPGIFPLAPGIPTRVGRLRAYGNAITPQVAAEFVRAFLETERSRVA